MQVNVQDFDGWTPLHAAAHWGQREACQALAENYANMDVKNYVGQTCYDVADPEVLHFLDELKKRQATMQKDRPEIRNLINRPPVPAERAVAAEPSVKATAGHTPHIAAGKRR